MEAIIVSNTTTITIVTAGSEGPEGTTTTRTENHTFIIPPAAHLTHHYSSDEAANDGVRARVGTDEPAYLPGQLVLVRGDAAVSRGIPITEDVEHGDYSTEAFRVLLPVQDPRYRPGFGPFEQQEGYNDTWERWSYLLQGVDSQEVVGLLRGCLLRLEVPAAHIRDF